MKIPFESKLINIENIKNRNAAFWKLSKEEQKKEIAFDALNLILVKKIKRGRSYWGDELHDIWEESNTSEIFQKSLLEIETCKVCAKGATALSFIRMGNRVNPAKEGISQCRNLENLPFTAIELYNMEDIYEGWKDTKGPYARRTEEILANIMCNIIFNGEFKITDKTDYLKQWKIKIN